MHMHMHMHMPCAHMLYTEQQTHTNTFAVPAGPARCVAPEHRMDERDIPTEL